MKSLLWHIGDAGQYVGQPGARINAVQLCGLDQAGKGAGGSADPASEARRQAVQGRWARGAERGDLRALDGLPVERAAEGPAAEAHGVGQRTGLARAHGEMVGR